MGQIIFYIIFAFITQVLTYKYVRHIDKKERKFLKEWEKEYISAYAEQWKKAYFDKLVEERKIKEYEEKLKKEKEARTKALKEVHINDFERYEIEYKNNLQDAVDRLEAKEEIEQ